ncbi:hypothetical protein D6_0010 [Aeromonas phage D6]|uniref:Uncharacterized protein n=1 Tax=Aeromonas phage D6 TaxID=2593322 RepID=A0A514TVW2_9CAUD|nr:hypothetical protein PQC08_gp265 [Aeromonas phage D6]QDJ97169.1 hypothetical protein D6_0010 [Aeromonas phage D6]
MTLARAFIERIIVQIILAFMAANWRKMNEHIVIARASGISQGIKTKYLGDWGPISVWLSLDGRAWSICIGTATNFITSRLTNGNWAFNRSVVENLYNQFEERRTEPQFADLDTLRLSIDSLLLELPIVAKLGDRIMGNTIRVLPQLNMSGEYARELSKLISVVFNGKVGLRGKPSGAMSLGISRLELGDGVVTGSMVHHFRDYSMPWEGNAVNRAEARDALVEAFVYAMTKPELK